MEFHMLDIDFSNPEGASWWVPSAVPSGTAARTATPTSTGPGCAAGCRTRVRRPAAHRDRQHRVRPDPVQRPPQRGGRERQAGRLRGRRRAAEPAGGLARRDASSARPRCSGGTWRRWRPRRCSAANPIDGVVLLGGCDKTIPSLLMAAASVDLPAVVVPGGPMLTGTFRGVAARLRHGRLAAERGGPRRHPVGRAVPRVRVVDDPQPRTLQHHGHRLDDGAGGRGARHDHPRPRRHAGPGQPAAGELPPHRRAGRRTGRKGRRPSTILSRGSFHNAIVALAAIGGSTNAVVHLLAIAGRLGIDLTLDDFDTHRIADVPLLVNLQPAGHFLMEDFHRAGGLLAVLREVRDLLDPTALTVTGQPLVDYLDDAQIWDREVISVRSEPLQPDAGIAVLYGNLAPAGAIIKPAAASPRLLTHRGRAVVFDSVEDMHARIDDPDLDVDADSVLVLRGCGPRGYPGMPEVCEPAAAQEAARAGRTRHGADLRRPDERHRVRHGGAARRSRRRPPADRSRSCRPATTIDARRRPPRPGLDVDAGRARPAGAEPRHHRRVRRAEPRLGAALRRPRHAGRHRRRSRLPAGSSGDKVVRESH